MFGKTNVYLGDEALTKMIKGVNLLANAVGSTLGPLGRNVVVQSNLGFFVTKDGVTVAKNIDPEDALESLGANLVKQAALKTNSVAGDGTTSSTVLAQRLINEGFKFLKENPSKSPVALKKEMEQAFADFEKFVHANKVSIKGDSLKIEQVATISANNDEELGKIIAEAYSKIGEYGIVTVEDSKSFETSVKITEGMTFDRGYMSPYFVTDVNKMIAEYDNCYILIYDGKINNVKHLINILDEVRKVNKPLLIISDEMDSQTISTLAFNKVKVNFEIVAVKSPGFGTLTKEYLHDIAALTGGVVISDIEGKPLESVNLSDLGVAKKIKVSKLETSIIVDQGDNQVLEERVNRMKTQLKAETSPWVIEKLQERLAKLTSGVAIIKLGAVTEAELAEKKYRLEDALQAVKAALKEGIVPGGGMTYINAARALEFDVLPFYTDGYSIVLDSLSSILEKICLNSGIDFKEISEKIEKSEEIKGFNAKEGVYVNNMIDSGIIDPAIVNIEALRNAISVAGLLLTTNCAVTKIEKIDVDGYQGYDPDMITQG